MRLGERKVASENAQLSTKNAKIIDNIDKRKVCETVVVAGPAVVVK